MTLTAHFIDKEWNYQKHIISFSLVLNHKGDTIGRKIEEVLMEWGIRNVSTITVDSASSNDMVVSYLNKRLMNKNGLMGEGDYFHMRFIRSSPQRALKFKECIDICNITYKKLLSLDVSTRWNSTYIMLEAVEKYQAAFDKLEGEGSGYLTWFGVAGPPTSDDWKYFEYLWDF
ncbi:zinc finger BED domain-containing protein RICESLEEPER 2-like [Cicer arietinum]|uniref:zinc finger BED domain-containing protein RICESLEEPER 2-like n=1 Tax=Cicer arietinum TaxID=3827 RepID=UPI003CC680D4